MRNNNDGQRTREGIVPRNHPNRGGNGFVPSFRTISSYLRIVSSGASTVASSVRSAASVASSIVDKEDGSFHDQVLWAGFDKLDFGDTVRQVLLLGYRSGFQVWDVEEAHNVCDLVSRYDGPASFLQVQPNPVASKRSEDKFVEARPLLVVCADGTFSGGDGLTPPCNGSIPNCHDQGNGKVVPTVVRFFSLSSQSYVHELKFRTAVYSVRCSSRVIAISQASQIHCLDAATLETEYTILTNPMVNSLGSGGIGYGPLAVGPRWLAYSGTPVVFSNSGRVSPQHLTPSASFPISNSNGSLVAHYAKESSKQLATGIVTLGDRGYKKLYRYCSELLPDGNNSVQSGSLGWKGNGIVNGHLPDADSVGMVIVRDIISKSVIAQFRAHKSPISALSFDPSGTLLVTASVQGHNINVFRITLGNPGNSAGSDAGLSYAHLYRLQRGFTNAVIQDICFSDDSHWIMISSSRGTNHLFAISPFGGSANLQSTDGGFLSRNGGFDGKPAVRWPPTLGLQMHNHQSLSASGPPVTLSVVSRIRSGNNGWKGTVTGAAAAATGRVSSISGAIASSFHMCKGNDLHVGTNSKAKYHLLVFSPSGCVIQYALRISPGLDSVAISGLTAAYGMGPELDSRLVVEAIQKWNICQKQNRREREDNSDIYGENSSTDSSKVYPEEIRMGKRIPASARGVVTRSRISPEERHHLYISEAELQMHQTQVPLWAKYQIYFQSMVMDGLRMEEENIGGEIEIERVPTRTFEARSKDLVPVFDYIHSPKFQQTRFSALDCKTNGQLPDQRPGLSENGSLSCRSSSGSLESLTEGNNFSLAEPQKGNEETGQDGLWMSIETTRGFVNNNDNPKTNTWLEK